MLDAAAHTVTTYRGTLFGRFVQEDVMNTSASPTMFAVGDLNGDGDPDHPGALHGEARARAEDGARARRLSRRGTVYASGSATHRETITRRVVTVR